MNRISRLTSYISFALAIGFAAGTAAAQDSGFMDDYSKLQPIDDIYLDRLFITPDVRERLQSKTAIMVDQPEIFISPESPYQGAKPDAMKILADTLREGMSDRVAARFTVVEEPGPNVIYLHWAITNLYLAKKKRKLYAYTPTGFVLNGAKNAMIQDIWKKVDIVEMTIEAELIDSQTDEVLLAAIIEEGARKDKAAGQKKRDPVTWEEIDAMMLTFGSRLTCRMENAKLPEAERQDCREIVIEADKT